MSYKKNVKLLKENRHWLEFMLTFEVHAPIFERFPQGFLKISVTQFYGLIHMMPFLQLPINHRAVFNFLFFP